MKQAWWIFTAGKTARFSELPLALGFYDATAQPLRIFFNVNTLTRVVFYNWSLVWLLCPPAGFHLGSEAIELVGLVLGCWQEAIRVSAYSPEMWL